MKNFLAISYILLQVAIIVAVPFAFIISLNTLFPSLGIGYGILEWVSALFIIMWFSKPTIAKG